MALTRRTTVDFAPLCEGWEAAAQQWISWARTPGHDSYWRFHRDQFLRLVPPPGRQTLDIGCGEGRLARDLKNLGHRVIAIDSSPSLVAAARDADPSMDIRLADAAALPLEDASADLAAAFMSLQDVDEMPTAVREIARVLQRGGKLCLAIVHPINSAGRFDQSTADAHFVIEAHYLRAFRYADVVERDGLEMTFHTRHRPLEAYFMALEEAGFLSRRCANRPFRSTPSCRIAIAVGSACRCSCTCAPCARERARAKPVPAHRAHASAPHASAALRDGGGIPRRNGLAALCHRRWLRG